MTAPWLSDQILGDDPITLPGNESEVQLGPKQMEDGIAIVGANVCSLFPSLKSVETARLAKKAVLNSKIDFEDVDYQMALKYITLVGGIKLLDRNGLLRVKPKWKGKRENKLTVGGDAAKDESKWISVPKRCLVETRK